MTEPKPPKAPPEPEPARPSAETDGADAGNADPPGGMIGEGGAETPADERDGGMLSEG